MRSIDAATASGRALHLAPSGGHEVHLTKADGRAADDRMSASADMIG